MALVAALESYLNGKGIEFEEISHSCTDCLLDVGKELAIPLEQIVTAVMVADGERLLMLATPLNKLIDVDELQQLLARELKSVPTAELTDLFPECVESCVPALGLAFDVPMVIDERVAEMETLYIASGTAQSLVRINNAHSAGLFEGAVVRAFCHVVGDQSDVSETVDANFARRRIISLVEKTEGLPAMPDMAQRLLVVSSDPEAGANELARVIELDPSLSAQVVSYARSAIYSYRGTIATVRDAISRVLGFDLVANLGLGIALAKHFDLPHDGALGLNHFWRHAVYCGALVEGLATTMPKEIRPRPGHPYLIGLLHNMGYLLLGYLYEPGYAKLNTYIECNPHVPISDLEAYVLGVSHQEIAAQLLQFWQMPQETIDATRWHHDLSYEGENKQYVHLIALANRILRRYGIGDEASGDLPPELFKHTGIDPERAMKVVEVILDKGEGLELLANQLAA